MYIEKNFHIVALSIIVGLLILISSCKRDNEFLEVGGRVEFSQDTVFFDTVFSSFKSSTHILTVRNKENKPVKIDVFLDKMDSSAYTLNVDGVVGKRVDNVEIAADDSAFIFITLLVDPTNDSIPFIVEDQLVAQVNEHKYTAPIIGYAQNAYYIKDSVLGTMTFHTDKPYVIMHSALVADGATVTIPAGVKVYMHRDSRLFVAGTLKIIGTAEERVVFQGDRIDRMRYVGAHYDIPGEWGGIYFLSSSHSNEMHGAELKNGGLSTSIGGVSTLGAIIQVDKDERRDGTPKLKMTNTIIKNSAQYGLVAFNTTIDAENCLIVDCQELALGLLEGGDYVFNDCTIGTFGQIRFFSRGMGTVSVAIQNFYQLDATSYVSAPLDATFTNCILYGGRENEFVASKVDDYPASVTLDNCVIRVEQIDELPSFVNRVGGYYNVDPQFVDMTQSDFHLSSGSPFINTGKTAGTLAYDLDGIMRETPTSIGAYQYKP